ncbi:MAG: hypothetical protein ACI9YU_000108 [Flavobacteriales bacterium]|jgi:hypothetical protein
MQIEELYLNLRFSSDNRFNRSRWANVELLRGLAIVCSLRSFTELKIEVDKLYHQLHGILPYGLNLVAPIVKFGCLKFYENITPDITESF